MTRYAELYRSLANRIESAEWLLPTLARLVFGGVLLVYYLNSGLTKLGDGLLGVLEPAAGAYAQIFPRTFEAVGYDINALGLFHRVIVVAGTMTEFLLPVFIVIGLLTRLSALGIIGFITLQSLTDVYGHGQEASLGAWFDRFPDALILDQRALWIFLLLLLVIKGAGPLSLDHAIRKRFG
ncbi:DoxX family protein [Sulfitobacter sp. S0837]|uniref:DoxX family protein n=1 Tax=Sulfitobacter maritimus TaxID=2741719 RepID=UPI00158316D6|nr:DoxX family protein [Sulfitobacter maritimus]NUH66045.1 DoxX family protein [Sulfitobacter maritimus]